jgi:trimethylamine:corrinoid methyltransferase-like protein
MYSETPDIIPFPTSFKSKVLTQAELETLKGGTLRLLDEVGVHFPSRKALEIFADHGAKVDMDTETVRIPPDLVQKSALTCCWTGAIPT